jgi:hypothetical protein
VRGARPIGLIMAGMSIYLELTRQFNTGRLRTIICSGQAVVLLRLAIASKDGDWILREDQEAIDHVLGVLETRRARYRFGAPLDLRWLRHGWSSHLEFDHAGLRVRTDFFTRPPRVGPEQLAILWREQEGKDPPFTGPRVLLQIKQTAREKDWPVVGELARLLPDPREQLLCSRSAQDLLELARKHAGLVAELTAARPALATIARGLDDLRMALERERFAAMDADAQRIRAFVAATAAFNRAWPGMQTRTAGLPLRAAHAIIVESAQRCLPTTPPALPPATSS